MENIIIEELDAEEIREAVAARRERIRVGRETGGRRYEGMGALERRMVMAKSTYRWMARKSTQKAVQWLEERFGGATALRLLEQWGEKGATVFLGPPAAGS